MAFANFMKLVRKQKKNAEEFEEFKLSSRQFMKHFNCSVEHY